MWALILKRSIFKSPINKQNLFSWLMLSIGMPINHPQMISVWLAVSGFNPKFNIVASQCSYFDYKNNWLEQASLITNNSYHDSCYQLLEKLILVCGPQLDNKGIWFCSLSKPGLIHPKLMPLPNPGLTGQPSRICRVVTRLTTFMDMFVNFTLMTIVNDYKSHL